MSGATVSPRRPYWQSPLLSWLLMVPTLWNAVVGYLVGTSIAVIGLYIAFILPVILRLRLGTQFEHGAWSLGGWHKLIDWIAIIWVTLICLLFIAPIAPAGIPWNDDFDWNVLNYAPAHRRRRIPALRRLVDPVCEELVQGTSPHGHRRRSSSCSRRQEAATSTFLPTRTTHRSTGSRAAARRAKAPRSKAPRRGSAASPPSTTEVRGWGELTLGLLTPPTHPRSGRSPGR